MNTKFVKVRVFHFQEDPGTRRRQAMGIIRDLTRFLKRTVAKNFQASGGRSVIVYCESYLFDNATRDTFWHLVGYYISIAYTKAFGPAMPFHADIQPSNGAVPIAEHQVQENIVDETPSAHTKNSQAEPTNKKPVPRTYLERIPIAGLHNLLYAEQKWEWYLWIVTLLLAGAVTVRYLVPAFTQYLEYDTALEIRHVSDPDVPFPTVHVCMSDAANGTRVHELADHIRPHLYNDSRYSHLADVITDCTTRECRLEWLAWQAVIYALNPPNWSLPWLGQKAYALNEVFSKIISVFGPGWPGLSSLYKEIMFKCENLLMRCEYNGIAFPCCSEGSDGRLAGRAAYFKLGVWKFLRVIFWGVCISCYLSGITCPQRSTSTSGKSELNANGSRN